MRKVVAAEYVTIDGVMLDPGGVGEIEQGGRSNPLEGFQNCDSCGGLVVFVDESAESVSTFDRLCG
jgi:hypothetical protein